MLDQITKSHILSWMEQTYLNPITDGPIELDTDHLLKFISTLDSDRVDKAKLDDFSLENSHLFSPYEAEYIASQLARFLNKAKVENLFRKQVWSCRGCGKDCQNNEKDYYMLKDKLWLSINEGEKRGMLCMDCVENRLGRKLIAQDIKPCLLTLSGNAYTKRVFIRDLGKKRYYKMLD